MNFIRENLLKIVIILGVLIIVIILVASCSSKPVQTGDSAYETMEQQLVEAAQSFTEKNAKFLPKEIGDSKSIKLSTLISNNEISELYANEDSNIACSGYVFIEKKTETTNKFFPHLKCGKYYETKTLADYILDNEPVVESDDGLRKSGDNYYFTGENPNNYLYIGELYYRIISINSNNEVKVISTEEVESTSWDDRFNSSVGENIGINNFEKSRLKETLENVYNNSDEEEVFNENLKSYIVPHDICIGKRSKADNDNISGSVECSVTSKNANLGIIQANEYLLGSSDPSCKSGSNYECGNYNYFVNISSSMMTQTASADNSYQIYSVRDGVLELQDAQYDDDIYAVFYLDANSLYSSGNGTYEKPYILR